MRKLIAALIMLTPFIGVGQSGKDSLSPFSYLNTYYDERNNIHEGVRVGKVINVDFSWECKPDTLRVVMLVTTKHMGIAHQRDGYVVMNRDCEKSYLDLNKRVIKNLKIWDYQTINPTSGKASKN